MIHQPHLIAGAAVLGIAAGMLITAGPRTQPTTAPTAIAPTVAATPAPPPPGADLPADPQVLAAPVAVVNGQDISLRAVEDAALRKEAADEVRAWLADKVDRLAWDRVADAAPLVVLDGVTLTRRDLAVGLLAKGVGSIREDLIAQTLVEQELTRTGTTLSTDLLEAEYRRIERKFHAELAKRGQPPVPYEDWLRSKRGQSRDAFLGERGFRLGAGLHAMVVADASASVDDTALAAWFSAQRSRYDEAEAVDLSTIFLPYRASARDATGPVVMPADRDALLSVCIGLWDQIRKGTTTFETTWSTYAASHERTGPGGRLGWVGRNGVRDLTDTRILPAAVMAAAFSDTTGLPRLLMPIQGETGIDLVRVHAWRPARTAELAAIRPRVVEDWIEDRLEPLTAAWMQRLKNRSSIVYKSLPELTRVRSIP
jgi:hypothetical protein